MAASWATIKKRAFSLNSVCFDMRFPLHKGGWTRIARDERIVISLAYPDEGGGGSVDSG